MGDGVRVYSNGARGFEQKVSMQWSLRKTLEVEK
jgi:hypothetical protein